MAGNARGRPPGTKKTKSNHNVKSLGATHTRSLLKLPKKERYDIIEKALRDNYGYMTGTAETLGMCRTTLNIIINKDEEHWKEVLLDIRESIADRFETLYIKNSLELDEKDAFKWAKEFTHLSNTLKARGWLKDPDTQINNNVSFTFKFDDGDDTYIDSPGQTISEK